MKQMWTAAIIAQGVFDSKPQIGSCVTWDEFFVLFTGYSIELNTIVPLIFDLSTMQVYLQFINMDPTASRVRCHTS